MVAALTEFHCTTVLIFIFHLYRYMYILAIFLFNIGVWLEVKLFVTCSKENYVIYSYLIARAFDDFPYIGTVSPYRSEFAMSRKRK